MFFSDVLSGKQGNLVDVKGGFWSSLFGSGGGNSSGMTVTPDTALGVPMLQNCVTLLAESVAQLPLELYERKEKGQREAAINHPLYDVLRWQPNGFQTPFESLECRQMAAGLRGNSYSFLDRRSDGNVTAIWPLHNDKVQTLKGADLLPYYRINGAEQPLPMRMIHHVRWSTTNNYVGLSPIELHAESIGMAQAIRHYTGKSFSNGVAVSGVIERPREAPAIKDQASVDRITGQWGRNSAAWITPRRSPSCRRV